MTEDIPEILAIYSSQPPEPNNVIIYRVYERLWKNNQNYILIVTGPTGSGKSYTALELARLIDPTFTIDNVVFSAKEFMELMRSGKIQKGGVVVWDESGVGLGARDFASVANKALNYFLQSFRCMNLCLILTLPVMGMLDITGRRLAHGYMETQKILRNENKVQVKMFELQTNPRDGEVYFHYPRTRDPDGSIKVIKKLFVHKPPASLTNKYEAKRRAWLEGLANNTLRTITGLEKKEIAKDEGEDRDMEIKSLADRVTKEFPELRKVKNGAPYYVMEMIQMKLGLGRTKAKMVKCLLEEEGISPRQETHSS